MDRRSSEDVIAAIATAEVQDEVALVLGFHEAERRREGVAELGDDPVDEGLRDGILGRSKSSWSTLGEAGFADDGTRDVVGRGLGLARANGTGSHLQHWALAQPMPVMAVNPR